MSALSALLGQIAVNGQPIELRGTLNFARGFASKDDPGMNTLSVVAGDPQFTGSATTTDATPTALISLGLIPDNTIAFITLRVVGRLSDTEVDNVMAYAETQAYRKTNGGDATAFGAADVSLSQKDDGTWGTPSLVLVGDVLTLKVTGKAATTIKWSGKVWVEFDTLPAL